MESEKSNIYRPFRDRSACSVRVCSRRFIGQSLVGEEAKKRHTSEQTLFAASLPIAELRLRALWRLTVLLVPAEPPGRRSAAPLQILRRAFLGRLIHPRSFDVRDERSSVGASGSRHLGGPRKLLPCRSKSRWAYCWSYNFRHAGIFIKTTLCGYLSIAGASLRSPCFALLQPLTIQRPVTRRSLAAVGACPRVGAADCAASQRMTLPLCRSGRTSSGAMGAAK
jgi:hypothetical protein